MDRISLTLPSGRTGATTADISFCTIDSHLQLVGLRVGIAVAESFPQQIEWSLDLPYCPPVSAFRILQSSRRRNTTLHRERSNGSRGPSVMVTFVES